MGGRDQIGKAIGGRRSLALSVPVAVQYNSDLRRRGWNTESVRRRSGIAVFHPLILKIWSTHRSGLVELKLGISGTPAAVTSKVPAPSMPGVVSGVGAVAMKGSVVALAIAVAAMFF